MCTIEAMRIVRIDQGRREASLAGLPLQPLMAPQPELAEHRHQCSACGEPFKCDGPDETGLCATSCRACMCSSLESQIRMYRSVVATLYRRRRALAKRTGRLELLRANESRERRRLQSIVAMGLAAPKFGPGDGIGTDDDDAA